MENESTRGVERAIEGESTNNDERTPGKDQPKRSQTPETTKASRGRTLAAVGGFVPEASKTKPQDDERTQRMDVAVKTIEITDTMMFDMPNTGGREILVPSMGPSPAVGTIKADGLLALSRLHGDSNSDDWRTIGAALRVITEEALVAVGATAWDPHNKGAVKEFNARWEIYEYRVPAETTNRYRSKSVRRSVRFLPLPRSRPGAIR